MVIRAEGLRTKADGYGTNEDEGTRNKLFLDLPGPNALNDEFGDMERDGGSWWKTNGRGEGDLLLLGLRLALGILKLECLITKI
jgi:hypothetical protein